MNSWSDWVGAAGMSCSARMRSHSSHGFDANALSSSGISASAWARRAEALERHDPAHRLEQGIEAGALLVGAVGAEGGDGGVDELRIDRSQRLVVHPQALDDPGAHVLHHHVGVAREAMDDAATVG